VGVMGRWIWIRECVLFGTRRMLGEREQPIGSRKSWSYIHGAGHSF
jgi:hypothetical protein